MTSGLTDRIDSEVTYSLRHHLTVIQAQSELLLNDPSDLSTERREALKRIVRSCYELDALVEPSPSPAAQPLPSTYVPETVRRVLIYTQNEYLTNILKNQPSYHAGLELVSVDTPEKAHSIIQSQPVDLTLADAVFSDTTGIDAIGNLYNSHSNMPPYALISLYTDESTPVALALSGILSPTANHNQIDTALEPFVESPEAATVAGFLTETPENDLNQRIRGCDKTLVATVDELKTRVNIVDIDADAVCLSPDLYRQLSPRDIGQLRTVSPGRGRPVLLVTSTKADPYDRNWIPTLGSRQFLHCPPDLVGLITQLLAYRSQSPSGIIDDQ